jgi:hypothetical protein
VNSYDVNLVPLQNASLCLDCEAITSAHTTCLCCGSQALLNIARILSHKGLETGCRRFPSLRHRSVTMESPFDRSPAAEQNQQLRFAARLANRA